MSVFEVFNNREIATFVCLLGFLAFCLRSEDVRTSFANVLRHLLSFKLLTPVFLLAIYIFGLVVLLNRLNLWNVSLLKDTLFWFFTAGMLTIYKYVSAREGRVPVGGMLLDNVKLVVILEFLMNTYTFSLLTEFIIAPIVTLIAMLYGYTETRKEDRDVAKILAGALSLYGFVLIAHALYSAVKDYQNLGTLDTAISFQLPILLSASIVPPVYVMAVFANYESLFVGFKFGTEKNREFIRYCKLRIFMRCGFSTRCIAKLRPLDLMHLASKEDVSIILRRLEFPEEALTQSDQHENT